MSMIRSFLKSYSAIILVVFSLLSCSKSNEDVLSEGKGKGKISYYAAAQVSNKSPKSSTLSADSTQNWIAVNWSYASVWVEKISFTAKRAGALDTTIMVQRNLNIFSTDALVGVIQLPEGSYEDVKVKMFCRKSPKSEFAFDFKGTFKNSAGQIDSIRIGSSYPFEADLTVKNMAMQEGDDFKIAFSFNLNNVLAGIKTKSVEAIAGYREGNVNSKNYMIWKGGSKEEPFYDQIMQNWQTVASVSISKAGLVLY